jgi:hypothetical protein
LAKAAQEIIKPLAKVRNLFCGQSIETTKHRHGRIIKSWVRQKQTVSFALSRADKKPKRMAMHDEKGQQCHKPDFVLQEKGWAFNKGAVRDHAGPNAIRYDEAIGWQLAVLNSARKIARGCLQTPDWPRLNYLQH